MTSKRRVAGLVTVGLVALVGAAIWAAARTPGRPQGPSPPTALTVIAGVRNTLRWEADPRAPETYRLYRSPSRSGPYTRIGTASADVFEDEPPAPGIFWYRLATVGTSGDEGPPSDPVSSDHVDLEATVGPEGGVLEPTTGTIRLAIPPGAVEAPTTFTIEQVAAPPPPEAGHVLVTHVFDIGPTGMRFSPRATLTLHYQIPHGLEGLSANDSGQITTRFWDPDAGTWSTLGTGSVEVANDATVTARIPHLSLWQATYTLPHGGYTDQTQLCAVCHKWHNSASASDLLAQPTETGVCYTCHGYGGTLEPNIETEFADGMRVSFHPVPVPDADGKHLVCSDCHAEHQSPSEDAGLLYLALGPEEFRFSPPEEPIGNDFCYSCHPDNADAQDQVVHNRVDPPNPDTGVTCTACHEPHAADFPHLMKAAEDTLCLECHSEGGTGPDVSTAFTAGVNDYGSTARIYHHPVATADQAATVDHPDGTRVVECASCHNTHLPGSTLVAPDTGQQWTGGISEFCMTCHQEQPPNDPVIAAGAKVPYAVRMVQDGHDRFSASEWPSSVHGEDGLECTDCHDQHGSSNAYMLKQAGGLTGFTDTTADWTNLQSLCASCHDPQDVQEHAADPEFADQQCTSCHYHTSERF